MLHRETLSRDKKTKQKQKQTNKQTKPENQPNNKNIKTKTKKAPP
jgi:hypothetical protein